MVNTSSWSVRCAVWETHGRRCWLCNEPVELRNLALDHVIPKSLTDEKRQTVFQDLGLPDDFDIDGFKNLLPSHQSCNRLKATQVFDPVPLFLATLKRLNKLAGKVAEREAKYRREDLQGLIETRIKFGLRDGLVSMAELDDIISSIKEEPFNELARSEILLLNNGRWIFRSEIVAEGECRCEQATCVGKDHKVYCYFTPYEHNWVVRTGLYQACYDEVIICPRCGNEHVRGHIGRDRTCGKPYRDQIFQCD